MEQLPAFRSIFSGYSLNYSKTIEKPLLGTAGKGYLLQSGLETAFHKKLPKPK